MNITAENATLVIELCESELIGVREQLNAAFAGHQEQFAKLDERRRQLKTWIAEAQAVLSVQEAA